MKFIIKWIKNNKKISFSIIALLALLIFVLYPGNDITCLDIVPPCDSQCSICPGRRCVKNGYSPFGTQAHLDFHSKRKLPNYKIWTSYGNYLSLLAGEVRNHTGGMGKDDGMDPDSGIGRQMDHHNGRTVPHVPGIL